MLVGPPSRTAYQSALDGLFARTGGRIEPGLARTEALLSALGDPHQHFASFHVAGTNGKGSTCAAIEALLRFRGLKVGRYTSPHLIDFRERIQVNGVAIGETRVIEFLERTRQTQDALGATFFEITTAMAFDYFASERVDVAVVETGLGGRLDSTNVITPLVAAVTNVSMDHMEYLGNTLPEIVDEKAGIFKFGRPAVIGEPRADLARRLADRAADRGASAIEVLRNDWRPFSIALTGAGTSFTASTPLGQLKLTTSLIGEHQARNALCAIATVRAAGGNYLPPVSKLSEALRRVHLPGRFHRVDDWIFDVAHNPAGARVLAETLREGNVRRPVVCVLGVLKDKDWRGMIDMLAPEIDTLIITQPASAPPDRAWDPMEAGVYAVQRGFPVILEVTFDGALLRAEGIRGTKVVTGSFHTVGDAMERLGIDPLAGNPAS
jgi:dihydrofolate synthase/folylpolyglutamate synthase